MKKSTIFWIIGGIVVYVFYKYSKKNEQKSIQAKDTVLFNNPQNQNLQTEPVTIAPLSYASESNLLSNPPAYDVLVKGDMASATYDGMDIWNDNATAIVLKRGDKFQGKYDENGSILFAYVTEFGDRTRLIPPEDLLNIVKLY